MKWAAQRVKVCDCQRQIFPVSSSARVLEGGMDEAVLTKAGRSLNYERRQIHHSKHVQDYGQCVLCARCVFMSILEEMKKKAANIKRNLNWRKTAGT